MYKIYLNINVMKKIFYFLIPIIGLLFFISCEEEDAASESFMLTHADTKWKHVDGDTTDYIHIDMDKIHEYSVDPDDSDCCTWSTATGTHADCDNIPYTNRMLINKGDTLQMDIIYGSTTMPDESVFMVVSGSTMTITLSHSTFTETHTYNKTSEALPLSLIHI